MTLIQIKSSYFCCGILVQSGKIVKAAPIVKYMIGWNGKRFKQYCNKKKFTYEMVSNRNS